MEGVIYTTRARVGRRQRPFGLRSRGLTPRDPPDSSSQQCYVLSAEHVLCSACINMVFYQHVDVLCYHVVQCITRTAHSTANRSQTPSSWFKGRGPNRPKWPHGETTLEAFRSCAAADTLPTNTTHCVLHQHECTTSRVSATTTYP